MIGYLAGSAAEIGGVMAFFWLDSNTAVQERMFDGVESHHQNMAFQHIQTWLNRCSFLYKSII